MKYLTKNKSWRINKEYDIDILLYLLIDRPDYVNHWNELIWSNKKRSYYRDYDLPSEVCASGKLVWWRDNIIYRVLRTNVFI